jgi:putative hydrolase of the HAD superfamily
MDHQVRQAVVGKGDNPVNDVGGGHSAGLRTIWVDNGRLWVPGVSAPDHTVFDARGAMEVLLQSVTDRGRTAS